MGAWADIWRWRDDRVRVAQLQEQIAALYDKHRPIIAAAGKPNTSPYEAAYNDLSTDLAEPQDELARILTRRRIDKAGRYGVPIPDRPARRDDSEYWERTRFESLVLTEKGHLLLRREIAIERDLMWKPVLSWAAIGISVISLCVAALKG